MTDDVANHEYCHDPVGEDDGVEPVAMPASLLIDRPPGSALQARICGSTGSIVGGSACCRFDHHIPGSLVLSTRVCSLSQCLVSLLYLRCRVAARQHDACHSAVGSMPGRADEVDVVVDDRALAPVNLEPPLARHLGVAAGMHAIKHLVKLLTGEFRECLAIRPADEVVTANKGAAGRVRGDDAVLRAGEGEHHHRHRVEDLVGDGQDIAQVQALFRYRLSGQRSLAQLAINVLFTAFAVIRLHLRGIVPTTRIPVWLLAQTPLNALFRRRGRWTRGRLAAAHWIPARHHPCRRVLVTAPGAMLIVRRPVDLGLTRKVALVVGASKGLGKACAVALAREGARVAICARSEDQLAAAAASIRGATGAEILVVPGDVANAQDIHAVVAATAERFGGIDILVNNSGGPRIGSFPDLTDDDWQRAFEVVTLNFVRFIREVVPHMRATQWGRIIGIQSSSVKQPVRNIDLSNWNPVRVSPG